MGVKVKCAFCANCRGGREGGARLAGCNNRSVENVVVVAWMSVGGDEGFMEVLGLAAAHRRDRFIGSVTFGLIAFFGDRAGKVGRILMRRRRRPGGVGLGVRGMRMIWGQRR